MKLTLTKRALACALALVCTPAAFAAPSMPVPDSGFAVGLDRHEALMREHRAAFPAYFEAAYSRYPELPRGSLEAVAFAASRWMHAIAQPEDSHAHQAPAHGVMGLRTGEGGFADTLAMASAASGIEPRQLIEDAEANILGTAALLSHWLSERGAKVERLEDMVPEFKRLSAIEGAKDSKVLGFAREAFAYDILLAADRGHDDLGIRVPEYAVQWERAFPIESLKRQRASFVRLDLDGDRIEIADADIDPLSGQLGMDSADQGSKSTDYGPALWVTSPYHSTRSASASAVTIHTMQGSYAGSINWFTNNPYSVSAHYLIRSSDGQVTQMVREYRAAHHVGSHNGYTLGIEHEGYISNSAWYTTAMYNASAALTRHFCARYSISCASAYNGAGHSGIVVLPTSTRIKGHQHFSNQTHTDPGQYWDWRRYYGLINPGSGGTVRVLDSFESSEGHFNLSPAYSGSTTGISTSSTAERVSSIKRNGSWSEQLKLVDNAGSSANWAVRFLSGGGSPSANSAMAKAGGRVGFWVYSGGSGLSAALGVDDSDGTERSIARSIPANTWTWLEWKLDDGAQWDPWVNGNGVITASSVTLDAIWFYRAQTSYTVYVYIDDVTYKTQ